MVGDDVKITSTTHYTISFHDVELFLFTKNFHYAKSFVFLF